MTFRALLIRCATEGAAYNIQHVEPDLKEPLPFQESDRTLPFHPELLGLLEPETALAIAHNKLLIGIETVGRAA